MDDSIYSRPLQTLEATREGMRNDEGNSFVGPPKSNGPKVVCGALEQPSAPRAETNDGACYSAWGPPIKWPQMACGALGLSGRSTRRDDLMPPPRRKVSDTNER